jgi:hypothetical protein
MSHYEHSDGIITRGFWFAGAFNVAAVLVFSKFFTNAMLASLDSVVFSWLGMVAIILWGLAYASVANSYQSVPYLVLVFFAEKMIYTLAWLMWLANNAGTLPSLFAESPLTAVAFASYGAADFAFGLFFLWVAIKGFRETRNRLTITTR